MWIVAILEIAFVAGVLIPSAIIGETYIFDSLRGVGFLILIGSVWAVSVALVYWISKTKSRAMKEMAKVCNDISLRHRTISFRAHEVPIGVGEILFKRGNCIKMATAMKDHIEGTNLFRWFNY